MPHTHAANKRTTIAHAKDRLAAHCHRAAVAALAAGWALLAADAIPPIPITLPDPLSDLIGWAVVTGTVILAVAALVRGRAMYAMLEMGRQLEVEARRHIGRQRTARRVEDEPTLGIGVSIN